MEAIFALVGIPASPQAYAAVIQGVLTFLGVLITGSIAIFTWRSNRRAEAAERERAREERRQDLRRALWSEIRTVVIHFHELGPLEDQLKAVKERFAQADGATYVPFVTTRIAVILSGRLVQDVAYLDEKGREIESVVEFYRQVQLIEYFAGDLRTPEYRTIDASRRKAMLDDLLLMMGRGRIAAEKSLTALEDSLDIDPRRRLDALKRHLDRGRVNSTEAGRTHPVSERGPENPRPAERGPENARPAAPEAKVSRTAGNPCPAAREAKVSQTSENPQARNAPARKIGALLEVRNLSVSFDTAAGRFFAVQGIDLTVDSGEVLAIVGESGSGKSVAMLAVMGLLPPVATVTADVLRFEGRDLLTMTARDRRDLAGGDMAMIFQEPVASLNPCFTVGFQIEETLSRHTDLGRAARRARAVELLTAVGIPEPEERLKSYPHQMSGGQCQRVMIAIATACNPKLLIADEPTTALDVTIQKQILELLLHLQAEHGMGLVLITHDMGVVAETADRVIVQYNGRKMEDTDVVTLFEDPASAYTRALLSALPENATGRRLPTVGSFASAPSEDRPT